MFPWKREAVIVAVAATKGGVGKTTLAVGLAEALAARGDGTVVLVDLDRQAEGGAADWADLADDPGPPLAAQVATGTTGDLAGLARLDAAHIVLDTPPAGPDVTRAAIAAAGLCVVAAGARAADLRRVAGVAAAAGDTPVVVALTMTRPGFAATDEARDALTAAGMTVAAATIPLRERIARSFGRNLTPAALAPFAALADELVPTTKEK